MIRSITVSSVELYLVIIEFTFSKYSYSFYLVLSIYSSRFTSILRFSKF